MSNDKYKSVEDFKIESHIEYPASAHGVIRKKKFDKVPLEKLKIGDSIMLEECTKGMKTAEKRARSIYACMRAIITSRSLEGTFRVKAIPKKGDEGIIEIRIWKL